MVSERSGTARRSSRVTKSSGVKTPEAEGGKPSRSSGSAELSEENGQYDWLSHSQRSMRDSSGKGKRRSSSASKQSTKQQSPKLKQPETSEEQVIQQLLASSTPAPTNTDVILLVQGLIRKVGSLESELERLKEGSNSDSHPAHIRNRDSMMLMMRDDSESSNFSYMNGSAIDWSWGGDNGRTSSLSSKPPPGRSLGDQVPSSMLLPPSTSNSDEDEKEEVEKKETKNEKEPPPARESATRWKVLHTAMLGTASSFSDGGEDEVRKPNTRRHSSQFSRKSSLVFMHPEDGMDCSLFYFIAILCSLRNVCMNFPNLTVYMLH